MIPVVAEQVVVGAGIFRLGLERDFLHFPALRPTEEEFAVEAADLLLGSEGSIEAKAAEEGFVDRGFDVLAGFELGFDLLAGIAETKRIEDGIGIGSGFGVVGDDRVFGREPIPVCFTKFRDIEGEDSPVTASNGDPLGVVRDELAGESGFSVGTLPITAIGMENTNEEQ